jgi:hypothetical protein
MFVTLIEGAGTFTLAQRHFKLKMLRLDSERVEADDLGVTTATLM